METYTDDVEPSITIPICKTEINDFEESDNFRFSGPDALKRNTAKTASHTSLENLPLETNQKSAVVREFNSIAPSECSKDRKPLLVNSSIEDIKLDESSTNNAIIINDNLNMSQCSTSGGSFHNTESLQESNAVSIKRGFDSEISVENSSLNSADQSSALNSTSKCQVEYMTLNPTSSSSQSALANDSLQDKGIQQLSSYTLSERRNLLSLPVNFVESSNDEIPLSSALFKHQLQLEDNLGKSNFTADDINFSYNRYSKVRSQSENESGFSSIYDQSSHFSSIVELNDNTTQYDNPIILRQTYLTTVISSQKIVAEPIKIELIHADTGSGLNFGDTHASETVELPNYAPDNQFPTREFSKSRGDHEFLYPDSNNDIEVDSSIDKSSFIPIYITNIASNRSLSKLTGSDFGDQSCSSDLLSTNTSTTTMKGTEMIQPSEDTSLSGSDNKLSFRSTPIHYKASSLTIRDPIRTDYTNRYSRFNDAQTDAITKNNSTDPNKSFKQNRSENKNSTITAKKLISEPLLKSPLKADGNTGSVLTSRPNPDSEIPKLNTFYTKHRSSSQIYINKLTLNSKHPSIDDIEAQFLANQGIGMYVPQFDTTRSISSVPKILASFQRVQSKILEEDIPEKVSPISSNDHKIKHRVERVQKRKDRTPVVNSTIPEIPEGENENVLASSSDYDSEMLKVYALNGSTKHRSSSQIYINKLTLNSNHPSIDDVESQFLANQGIGMYVPQLETTRTISGIPKILASFQKAQNTIIEEDISEEVLQSHANDQKIKPQIDQRQKKKETTTRRRPRIDTNIQAYIEKTYGQKKILFHFEEDLLLFNLLLEWRTKNPDTNLETAYQVFESTLLEKSAADVFLQILFTSYKYPYILKYDKNDSFQSLRDRFEGEILKEGLFLEREVSVEDPSMVYLKIIAPFNKLCEAAERSHHRKLVKKSKATSEQAEVKKTRLSTLASFFRDDIINITKLHAPFRKSMFDMFTPDELLNSKIWQLHEDFFDERELLLLTQKIISRTQILVETDAQSKQMGLHHLLERQVYQSIFSPHHSDGSKNNLKNKLLSHLRNSYFKMLPSDTVRNYFGEKTASFFIFVDFFIFSLFIPSLLGLIVFLFGIYEATRNTIPNNWIKLFDNALAPWFGFIISVWGILFVHFLQRKKSYLSFIWQLPYKPQRDREDDRIRPEYQSGQHDSHLIDEVDLYSPDKSEFQRKIVCTIGLVCIWCVTAGSVVGCALFRDYTASISLEIQLDSVANALLALLSMLLLRSIARPLITFLNNWENYKTQKNYERALVFKLGSFELINVFGHLLYLAFWKPLFTQYQAGLGISYTYKCGGYCTLDVFYQLFLMILGDLIIYHFVFHLYTRLVSVYRNLNLSSSRKSVHPQTNADKSGITIMSRLPSHYQDDMLLAAPPFFFQYAFMMLLFSYSTLFVAVIPILPIFVMLSLLFTQRLEARQFLLHYIRGIPVQAIEFAKFIPVLNFISFLATTTNALIVVLTSGYFEDTVLVIWDIQYWWGVRFTFVLIWHIAVHLIVMIVKVIMPATPSTVKMGWKRQFLVEERLLNTSETK